MNGKLTTDLTRTHKRAILAHLKAGKPIDLKTSLDLFGCASLRSRISELRDEGWPIRSDMVKFQAPSGFWGRFAVYSLDEQFLKRLEKEDEGKLLEEEIRFQKWKLQNERFYAELVSAPAFLENVERAAKELKK